MSKEIDIQKLEKYLPDHSRSEMPESIIDFCKNNRAHFIKHGFPHTKQEDWRFTNLKFLEEHDYQLSPNVNCSEIDLPDWLFPDNCHHLKLVNGLLTDGLNTAELSDKIQILPLNEAIAENSELVLPLLEGHKSGQSTGLQALNSAHLLHGLLIHVPAGVNIEQPLHIFHWSQGDVYPAVNHIRNLVILDQGAQLTVVEHFMGTGIYWNNHVTEVSTASNSHLKYYRIQDESLNANHTATTRFHQSADSSVQSISFDLGSGLHRNDMLATLADEGAHVEMDGLFVTTGSQHIDNHTIVHHSMPNCTSSELFKGILTDKSNGVFNGLIKVDKDAQKTDSKQTNRNLLLSNSAQMNSNPQLEIYADDVKCSHGSTTGQLDEDALFYLRSRGISTQAAIALMIRGFANEILDQIKHPGIRNLVWQSIIRKVPELAGSEEF